MVSEKVDFQFSSFSYVSNFLILKIRKLIIIIIAFSDNFYKNSINIVILNQ